MPRQFTLRTFFFLTALVAVGCLVGPPAFRGVAWYFTPLRPPAAPRPIQRFGHAAKTVMPEPSMPEKSDELVPGAELPLQIRDLPADFLPAGYTGWCGSVGGDDSARTAAGRQRTR
jgi:hypothetical protein